MQKKDDISQSYQDNLIDEDSLSIFEKRKAAKAIVDLAIISEKNSLVTEDTREHWIQEIIDNPENTSKVLAKSKNTGLLSLIKFLKKP